MKKAYVFPGQGAQFVGMGHDLYTSSPLAKEMFDRAKALLGKSSNKTVKDIASAADTLGLTGIESV